MSTFDKHDLSGFVGKHLVYTYDNDWNYEIYVKNENTTGLPYSQWSGGQPLGERSAGLHRPCWESIYKISGRSQPVLT